MTHFVYIAVSDIRFPLTGLQIPTGRMRARRLCLDLLGSGVQVYFSADSNLINVVDERTLERIPFGSVLIVQIDCQA